MYPAVIRVMNFRIPCKSAYLTNRGTVSFSIRTL